MSTVRLGEIATWGSGGTPSRSVREYFGEGIPWLSIADLTDGPVSEAKESLTQLGIQNSSAKIVPAGTLFVAMYGSIGKLGIATREFCTSQAIAFAIPDQKRVDTRYLFHFLLAQRPQLESQGRGGTQKNISQGVLRKWEISLPPLPEQKRIAAILDQADTLRAKRRAAINKLDELTQSIFLDMFGDPAVNPKVWPKVELGKCTSAIQIGPFGSLLHRSDYINQGIPLINPKHIQNGKIEIEDEETISTKKFEELELYHLKIGDVIMGRRGEMGRCAIVEKQNLPALCGTGSIIIRPDIKNAISLFLSYILSSQAIKRELENQSLGQTLPNLNAKIVCSLKIPLPPIPIQNKFAMTVEAITVQSERLKRASVNMERLFSSLQHRAFTGTL